MLSCHSVPRAVNHAEAAHVVPETSEVMRTPGASSKSQDLRFPIEVWQMIFEATPTARQRNVAKYARICKPLRHAVESLLYRLPRLHSFRSAQKFARTVSSCPRRANLVRGLEIGSWKDNVQYVLPAFQEPERAAALRTGASDDEVLIPHRTTLLSGSAGLTAFVHHLPLLDTVALLDQDAFRYAEQLIRAGSLTLRRLCGMPLESTMDAMDFLRAHPELEEASLSPLGWSGLARLTPLGQGNLRVLSCGSQAIRRTFGESFPRLTHLNVTHVQSPNSIDRIIQALGQQLISLRIEQMVRANVCKLGRMYPTNEHQWGRCARLKYL
ncbi:hypothetical protein BD311DRAFT_328220 [Dichomitus squalens]|uniref:F-box domain-containing protein n=1 Tax=Dichomitus squalens TaxID=114155 RepID=A0A4V2K0C7_9APHY|nr:hypothetical protein BD311DRAFT_328220 [Dichomitus squalens]